MYNAEYVRLKSSKVTSQENLNNLLQNTRHPRYNMRVKHNVSYQIPRNKKRNLKQHNTSTPTKSPNVAKNGANMNIVYKTTKPSLVPGQHHFSPNGSGTFIYKFKGPKLAYNTKHVNKPKVNTHASKVNTPKVNNKTPNTRKPTTIVVKKPLIGSQTSKNLRGVTTIQTKVPQQPFNNRLRSQQKNKNLQGVVKTDTGLLMRQSTLNELSRTKKGIPCSSAIQIIRANNALSQTQKLSLISKLKQCN